METMTRSKALLHTAAATALLSFAFATTSQARPICDTGGIVRDAQTGTMIGCIFHDPNWGLYQQGMCNGIVTLPTLNDGTCHVCVPQSYATTIQNGNWSVVTPSDLTCLGCVDPPSGLVGWWPLDEKYLGYAATPLNWDTWGWHVGNPVPMQGRVLNGLQLDGIDDYVEVDDWFELDFGVGDFSFDAWVRFTASDSGGVRTLVDKRQTSPYRGYSFFLYYGKPGVQLADGVGYGNFIASSAVPADNNWHFVAVSVSRSQGASFYIDGILVNPPISVASRPGSLDNASNLRIGTHSFDLYTSFKGGIDEVELFNRALTAQEVQSIYNAGFYGKCRPTLQ